MVPSTLVVHTTGDLPSVVAAMREAVWSVDPDQPASEIVTMDGVLDRELGQRRVQALLLGGRRPGIDACLCWDLRRDGLPGDTTQSRDWSPAGARSLFADRRCSCPGAGGEVNGYGGGNWNRGRTFGGSAHAQSAFRREPYGPTDVCVRGSCVDGCRLRSLLHPGASRRTSRSHHGLTLRVVLSGVHGCGLRWH
jgi:hypothetical protein